MQTRGMTASQPGRVEALRARHAALSQQIEREQSRLSASDMYLRNLKRQKLALKEELEGIKDVAS